MCIECEKPIGDGVYLKWVSGDDLYLLYHEKCYWDIMRHIERDVSRLETEKTNR